MLLIAVEEAEAGMKLAMSVVHPEHPDQELLRPGFILEKAVLTRLRQMEVGFIYVDYPDLGDLDKHLEPYLSPARQTIYNQIKQTIAAVQQQARPTVTFTDYYIATRELVLTVMQQGDYPVYLDLISHSMGLDAVEHATAVAQLSITLGIRLEQYLIRQRSRLAMKHAREVVNLGVGAMLHDVGKAKLAEDLQTCSGVNPPEDPSALIEWEAHPQIGADMLRHGIEASAVATVAQHHQHYDGSGFPAVPHRGTLPKPREGRDIHVFARILLAADLYDRLSVDPQARKKRWPVEILHLMQTQYWGWMDPQVAAMLPKVIPPFPPGTRVTLTDGTRAIVTVIDPDQPYWPTVRRVVDGKLKLAEESIPLSRESGLYIKRMGGIDVEPFLPMAAEAAE